MPQADPSSFLPISQPMFHVLLSLGAGDKHGWGILKDVDHRSRGKIRLSPGTLYGIIKRLLDQGLIADSDARPPRVWDDERRRYYRLTELGRRVVRAEVERMEETLALVRDTDWASPDPSQA